MNEQERIRREFESAYDFDRSDPLFGLSRSDLSGPKMSRRTVLRLMAGRDSGRSGSRAERAGAAGETVGRPLHPVATVRRMPIRGARRVERVATPGPA